MKNYNNLVVGFILALKEEKNYEENLLKIKNITKSLLDFINSDELFFNFFSSTSIDENEKYIKLKRIFENNLYVNFLMFIIRTRNLFFINDILSTLLKLINKELKIFEATLWITQEIPDELKNKIHLLLEKKYNCKLELNQKIDSELIGGIKVEFKDSVIDYSYKTILSNLYKEFVSKEIGV